MDVSDNIGSIFTRLPGCTNLRSLCIDLSPSHADQAVPVASILLLLPGLFVTLPRLASLEFIIGKTARTYVPLLAQLKMPELKRLKIAIFDDSDLEQALLAVQGWDNPVQSLELSSLRRYQDKDGFPMQTSLPWRPGTIFPHLPPVESLKITSVSMFEPVASNSTAHPLPSSLEVLIFDKVYFGGTTALQATLRQIVENEANASIRDLHLIACFLSNGKTRWPKPVSEEMVATLLTSSIGENTRSRLRIHVS